MGITPEQATLLADRYHIYLLHTGRVSITGREYNSSTPMNSAGKLTSGGSHNEECRVYRQKYQRGPEKRRDQTVKYKRPRVTFCANEVFT